MAIANLAFGPYTSTWDGFDVGLTEGPIFIQQTPHAVDARADLYGQARIDGIFAGGDFFLVMTLKEWNATTQDMLWPFGIDPGISAEAGRSLQTLAKQIILTAAPGTQAAVNGPAGITLAKAILSPEHNVSIPLGTVERNVPLVFSIYPAEVGANTLRYYTLS